MKTRILALPVLSLAALLLPSPRSYSQCVPATITSSTQVTGSFESACDVNVPGLNTPTPIVLSANNANGSDVIYYINKAPAFGTLSLSPTGPALDLSSVSLSQPLQISGDWKNGTGPTLYYTLTSIPGQTSGGGDRFQFFANQGCLLPPNNGVAPQTVAIDPVFQDSGYFGNTQSSCGPQDSTTPLVILGEYNPVGPSSTSATSLPSSGSITSVRFFGGPYFSFTLYVLTYAGVGPNPGEQKFTVQASENISYLDYKFGGFEPTFYNAPLSQPLPITPGSFLAFAGNGITGTITSTDANIVSDAVYEDANSGGSLSATPPVAGHTYTMGPHSDPNADYDYAVSTQAESARYYSIGVEVANAIPQGHVFQIALPESAAAGQAVPVIVSTADGSSPTVTITCSDPKASFPGSVQLINGTATFSLTFNTPGSQTVTVAATGYTPSTSSSIDVTCPQITQYPTTSTLPAAIVGTSYFQQIFALGGAQPYKFTVTAGTLPPDLVIPIANSIASQLSGTPTTANSYAFTVTATDANGCSANINYTLQVTAPTLPAPTANSQSFATFDSPGAHVTLTGSDPDLPPVPLTYTVPVNTASGGQLRSDDLGWTSSSIIAGVLSIQWAAANNAGAVAPTLTYIPPSHPGSDSFTFTVNNGSASSPPATVSISILTLGQTLTSSLTPSPTLGGVTAALSGGKSGQIVSAVAYASNPDTGAFNFGGSAAYMDLAVVPAAALNDGDTLAATFYLPSPTELPTPPQLNYLTAGGASQLVLDQNGIPITGVWDPVNLYYTFSITFNDLTPPGPGGNGGTVPTISQLTGTVFAMGTPAVPPPTPVQAVFSGLSNRTNIFGTSALTLFGTVSGTGGVFPSVGELVTATINGITSTGIVQTVNGGFSIDCDVSALPVNSTAYTINYSYPGDASLSSASDASTTLAVNKAAPVFFALGNPSIPFGTASIILTGTVRAASASPASGETVTATINSHSVNGVTTDTNGDFTITYNDASLATDPVSGSPYPIIYSYSGNASLSAASDSSTTLTVTPVNSSGTTFIGNTLPGNYGGADGDPPFVILGEYNSAGPLQTSTLGFTSPGTIQDVKFFGQNYAFTLYVLSPVEPGPNALEQTFRVVGSETFSSSSVSSAGVQILPVSGLTVGAGDLLAFVGVGPGYNSSDALNSDATYEDANSGGSFTATAPTAGEIFTVGMNGDSQAAYEYISDVFGNQGRVYAIGVDVSATTPALLAPTANSGSRAAVENTALNVNLSGSDPNSPPQPLTFTIITTPTKGTLSPPTASTPTFTYTPNAGYTGQDSFMFEANNGTFASSPATVSVTVRQGATIAMSGGGFALNFIGAPGQSFKIQHTDSLAAPISWTDLVTVSADSTGLISYTDTTTPLPQTRYYRVVPSP